MSKSCTDFICAAETTPQQVLPLVFALVWLSLLVDSCTSSAVVHTVAPTSVVVVLLLLLPKSVVVMPATSGATSGQKLQVPM
jgi:hypothetical protein